LTAANDPQIWDYASRKGAILISKDEDFAVLSTLGTEGPAVIWICMGNTRKQALLAWFEQLRPTTLYRYVCPNGKLREHGGERGLRIQ
jgi:predicted nuclease of predicted toxin-antitoxin system